MYDFEALESVVYAWFAAQAGSCNIAKIKLWYLAKCDMQYSHIAYNIRQDTMSEVDNDNMTLCVQGFLNYVERVG